MPEQKKIDHRGTDEAVCPHCGVEDEDSWEYDENTETDCGECGQRFSVERITTVTYTTRKVKPKETT